MNERIKELMKHAGTDSSGKWMGIQHAEKFAELIVKECLGQVADVRIEHDFDPVVDEVLVQALTGIKKHFGVTE
jgi:hypothetical protein